MNVFGTSNSKHFLSTNLPIKSSERVFYVTNYYFSQTDPLEIYLENVASVYPHQYEGELCFKMCFEENQLTRDCAGMRDAR